MLVRLGAAANLLGRHHSAQAPAAMGRWRSGGGWGDSDGWSTVRHNRNASRDDRRQRSGSGGRPSGDGADLQQENRRLKERLAAAERARTLAFDRTPHPGAVERPREGDWLCANLCCGFGSNRHERMHCYKCGQPRAASFPAVGAGAVPGASLLSAPAGAATSLRPGQLPPAAVPGQPAAPPPTQQEKIRALKSKLDLLKSARALYEGNADCGEQLRKCDADIAEAQAALTSCVPVEVAVKSTIAPASQARVALQRAEAKLAKLEGQVVSAVASYEAAAAEVEECRQKLADAEAATARAAAGSLPHSDLVAAMSRDPAAAWEAMLASIEVRTPGMPEGLLQHLRATTAALKQLCSLLPKEPTAASSAGGAGCDPPGGAPAAAAVGASAPPAAALQPSAAAEPGAPEHHLPSHQHQQLGADAAADREPPAQGQPSVDDLQAQLRAAQEHARAQECQLLALRAAAAAAAAGTEVAALPEPPAPSPTTSTSTSTSTDASTAMAAVASPPAAAPAAANGALPAVGDSGDDLGATAQPETCPPGAATAQADDEMGGAAPNAVARKRAAEAALESARGIAAKAKAKSKAQ